MHEYIGFRSCTFEKPLIYSHYIEMVHFYNLNLLAWPISIVVISRIVWFIKRVALLILVLLDFKRNKWDAICSSLMVLGKYLLLRQISFLTYNNSDFYIENRP